MIKVVSRDIDFTLGHNASNATTSHILLDDNPVVLFHPRAGKTCKYAGLEKKGLTQSHRDFSPVFERAYAKEQLGLSQIQNRYENGGNPRFNPKSPILILRATHQDEAIKHLNSHRSKQQSHREQTKYFGHLHLNFPHIPNHFRDLRSPASVLHYSLFLMPRMGR